MDGFAELPLLARWAIAGAGTGALTGGVIGLVVGLRVHAATAWFAVLEAGLPAAILGGTGGIILGLLVQAVRRMTR